MYNYRPIIIIGAARSGTKLIRDMIAHHPDVDCIPYDINYIWRIGNDHFSHDELPVSALTPSIRRHIIDYFNKSSTGKPFMIEKTVSNCLRVPFVHAVFPDAIFIHLIRDGRDVIESVQRQWISYPDWKYVLEKSWTFPILQSPSYALKYVTEIFKRKLRNNKTKDTHTWGPRYKNIDKDVEQLDLIEVCAIQWVRSVEYALRDLALNPTNRVINVRYEDFVQNPHIQLTRLLDQIGLTRSINTTKIVNSVLRTNVGKGISALNELEFITLMKYANSVLVKLGYLEI